jgi:hypothetical protein
MDIEDLNPKDLEILRERHKEIKEARRNFANTILGLSGGAIVLSITFLDRIAPGRHWLTLLFIAWFFFALSAAACLLELWQLVKLSVIHQLNIMERYLRNPAEASNLLHQNSQFISPIHFYALILFGCGIIFFATFAVRNAVG